MEMKRVNGLPTALSQHFTCCKTLLKHGIPESKVTTDTFIVQDISCVSGELLKRKWDLKAFFQV